MNRKIMTGFLAMVCTATFAQDGFVIKGKVENLQVPATAFLSIKENGKRVMDSVKVSNGSFEFKGKVNGPNDAHIMLRRDKEVPKPGMRPTFDVKAFFIENKTINLTAKDSIARAVITGSPLNDDNEKLTALLKPYYDRFGDLNEEYKRQPKEKREDRTFILEMENKAQALEKTIKEVKWQYAKENPTKYTALVALVSTMGPQFDALSIEKIYNTFSAQVKASDLGKEAAQKIAQVRKTQEGVSAPDFTQSTAEGKAVKLSDFRGKYVLVDFWASWCGPCRRENPNLVKSYNQYKDKGFTVLGVSLDKPGDKEKWLKAIKDDGLVWTQVSDLKGWENAAAQLYDVKAIPMNFLIDPSGKIVGKYLRGEALDKKLAELLVK